MEARTTILVIGLLIIIVNTIIQLTGKTEVFLSYVGRFIKKIGVSIVTLVDIIIGVVITLTIGKLAIMFLRFVW